MKALTAWTLGVASLLVAPIAAAGTITFTGSGTAAGNSVSASADFTITGTSLTITLTNTSGSNDNWDKPGSTLTGLFFDLGSSNPQLTPVSATLFGGSSIYNSGACDATTCDGVTNVGGEFGYNVDGEDGNNFGGRGGEGIASSGYLETGVPGNLGNFNGTDLDSPASLDGINFGLISSASGFNPNGGLASEPLIQNSVQFELTLPDATFDISDISNVSFQYGTSFSETSICAGNGNTCTPIVPVPVPEPGGLLLLGFGLLGVGGFSYVNRRRHGKSSSRRTRDMLQLEDYLARNAGRP